MAYYDINTQKFISDNLPARKRVQFPVLDQLAKGLLSPFTRWVAIFKAYKEGVSTIYAPGTYDEYDMVVYNGQVFECYVNGTTTAPDDTSRWRLLFRLWRGTNEGQNYNGTSMELEYALNRCWNLTFSPIPLTSSIRVVTNIPPTPQFFASTIESTASTVGTTDVLAESYAGLTYSVASTPASFTIRVPLAWYTGLGADAENKIRSFVNQYVTEGVTYNIQIYI